MQGHPSVSQSRETRTHGTLAPASYVERQNLNIRMGIRRFARLTNAFGKKLENQVHAFALYLVFYNFCRIHKSLRMSPAMAAGVTDTLRRCGVDRGLIDARTPAPKIAGAGSRNEVTIDRESGSRSRLDIIGAVLRSELRQGRQAPKRLLKPTSF